MSTARQGGSVQLKGILKIGLKLGFSFGLVAWLIHKGMLDLGELWQTTQWYHFVGGIVLCTVMMGVISTRWWLLVRKQGVDMSYIQAFKLTLMGQFFSYALPGGVSGDMVKGYYVIKASGGQKTNALVSILMDRLIGFWAMSFLASVGLFFKWNMVVQDEKVAALGTAISLLFFGFTTFIALTFFISEDAIEKKMGAIMANFIGRIFIKVYRSIRVYSQSFSVLVKAFFLSILSQASAIVFMALAGYFLLGTEGIDWPAFFFAVPLGFIAMAIPISPAGIGVGQAVLFFLFNLVLGQESNLGPTVITAFQFVLFCVSLPGIIFYLRARPTLQEPVSVG